MKKFSLLIICLSAAILLQAQTPDVRRRSLGLYVSPGLGDFEISGPHKDTKTSFIANLGYRFVNQVKGSFFLEGGVGFGFDKGYDRIINGAWNEHVYNSSGDYYEVTHDFLYRTKFTETNWSVPFLVGYKSKKGKIRFQGGLGFAFNLKILETNETEILSGTAPHSYYFGYSYYNHRNEAMFGTGFSAIARAGITVPICNWAYIDILPTARYRMFYFTSGYLDLTKIITNKVQPWSLGLDVSLMFSLKDKKKEPDYHTSIQELPDTPDNTTIEDSVKSKRHHSTVKNDVPRNMIYFEFAGNGILYSVNYERKVFQKGIMNINFRGGIGYIWAKFALPIGANITLGAGRQKFEAGLTCTFHDFNSNGDGIINWADRKRNYLNLSIDPSIAFRLENRKHLFFRLAVLTHFFPVTGGISPGAGISLGKWF